MTREEAERIMANTIAVAESDGMWNKFCSICGRSVGGRLAGYGMPTEEELARCICPYCNTHSVRTEFIVGSTGAQAL